MAFKITKQEQARLQEIADRVAEERLAFDTAVDEANAAIEDIYSALNERITRYNEMLEEGRGVIEDIHSERQSDFDDKSERWQEGERGEATREWLDKLDSDKEEIEDITELTFEPLDFSDVADHVEKLTEIEAEPNY
jgi:hypothetical protein